ASAGRYHEGTFDAHDQIFRAQSSGRARESGFDAEPFDGVDPRRHDPTERPSKAMAVDAGRETLDQAGFFSAVVEHLDGIEHLIEFPLWRSRRPCGFEQRTLELILKPYEHLQRHLLLAVWKMVIQARLAKTGCFRDVGHRCAVESLLPKEI